MLTLTELLVFYFIRIWNFVITFWGDGRLVMNVFRWHVAWLQVFRSSALQQKQNNFDWRVNGEHVSAWAKNESFGWIFFVQPLIKVFCFLFFVGFYFVCFFLKYFHLFDFFFQAVCKTLKIFEDFFCSEQVEKTVVFNSRVGWCRITSCQRVIVRSSCVQYNHVQMICADGLIIIMWLTTLMPK